MAGIDQIYKKVLTAKPSLFWPGFIVGLFYFGWIFFWFWSVHSLVSFGFENKISASLLILLPYIITIVGMALFWGIFTYASYAFSKKAVIAVLPLFYAGTFVVTEYLRALFFGILWAGRESLLGSHWTLGNPAYLFANFNFIRQSASYWGIYGVDFLIVFFGTALFMLIKLWRKKSKAVFVLEIISVIAVLTLINSISLTNNSEIENEKLTISAIQTKNPIKTFYQPEELLTDFSEKNRLLKEATAKSDVVVFPESADFSKTLSGFLDFSSVQKYFNNLSTENVLIIDNNRITEQKGLKSKVLLIDSKEGVVGFYDKKLLTPGGESLPYLAKVPLSIFEYLTKNDFVSSGTIFAKGEKSSIQNYQENKIKILVCSDIISPGISAENGEFGFMVNLNNLAVFDGSQSIENQLLSIARFRATENGKYLIISSNFGHSYIIDPAGNIVDSTASTGYQILTKDIVPNKIHTWYNKLGDIPVLILSFLMILTGLKTTRSRRF